MDQNTARCLARDAGNRATELGLTVANAADPDCAELAAECRRVGAALDRVLR